MRTWHLLRHLARHHRVTYLAFSGRTQSQADPRRHARRSASRLETVPREEPAKGTPRFYADVLAHALDPLPYAVGKYRSRAYRRRLGALLETGRFDLDCVRFPAPAVNLPRRLPCPAVLFTHNVEAEIWRRHAEVQSNALMRWFFRSQWRRMLAFQPQAISRFDLILAVSQTDRATLQRVYGPALRAPVTVVPTGVDTEYFKPSSADAVEPHRLVFTGAMDRLPNDDAIRYFCREILPRVRDAEPRTTLAIVGRAPSAAVRRLADQPGITVTGFVDDVRPYLAQGAVYVVPLRIGEEPGSRSSRRWLPARRLSRRRLAPRAAAGHVGPQYCNRGRSWRLRRQRGAHSARSGGATASRPRRSVARRATLRLVCRGRLAAARIGGGRVATARSRAIWLLHDSPFEPDSPAFQPAADSAS